MKKKCKKILTQQSNSSLQDAGKQISERDSLPSSVTKQKDTDKKNSSSPQIQHKSSHIVNDNFVNKLNPKRSSIDLTSFIQVFRKKIRQTTIARQFENSLEKFKSLSQNRATSYTRQKGGFVGSCKKQNELLVQNNRIDNKIKKIIISDMQFRERKIKSKQVFGQGLSLEKQTKYVEFEDSRQKGSRFSRKILKYAQNDKDDEVDSNTISFSTNMYNPQKLKENPEHMTETLKMMTDYTPNLYYENEKGTDQNWKKNKTSLFQNRRLQTISTYQRPNLMYNLSLYRKKQSYNALKNNKKRTFHTQNNE